MRFAVLAPLLLAVVIAACGGGATKYEVTVRFNTSVTQDDLARVAEVLLSYDEDLEFLIQESFPPTGRAFLETDVPNFCRTIEPELEPRTYVDGIDCGRR